MCVHSTNILSFGFWWVRRDSKEDLGLSYLFLSFCVIIFSISCWLLRKKGGFLVFHFPYNTIAFFLHLKLVLVQTENKFKNKLTKNFKMATSRQLNQANDPPECGTLYNCPGPMPGSPSGYQSSSANTIMALITVPHEAWFSLSVFLIRLRHLPQLQPQYLASTVHDT